MPGDAAQKIVTLSFDQAVEEIARVHFKGDMASAEAELIEVLSDSTITAHHMDRSFDAISSDRWSKPNVWTKATNGPILRRKKVCLFCSHLQELYDNTLWVKVGGIPARGLKGSAQPKRRGRKPGSGSMAKPDAPYIKKMKILMDKGMATSAHNAAFQVVKNFGHEIAGNNPTQKQDRLARRYRREFN